jgi:hypothetical protein
VCAKGAREERRGEERIREDLISRIRTGGKPVFIFFASRDKFATKYAKVTRESTMARKSSSSLHAAAMKERERERETVGDGCVSKGGWEGEQERKI